MNIHEINDRTEALRADADPIECESCGADVAENVEMTRRGTTEDPPQFAAFCDECEYVNQF